MNLTKINSQFIDFIHRQTEFKRVFFFTPGLTTLRFFSGVPLSAVCRATITIAWKFLKQIGKGGHLQIIV